MIPVMKTLKMTTGDDAAAAGVEAEVEVGVGIGVGVGAGVVVVAVAVAAAGQSLCMSRARCQWEEAQTGVPTFDSFPKVGRLKTIDSPKRNPN